MSNSKDTVQELTDTMLDRIEARFMAGKFDLY